MRSPVKLRAGAFKRLLQALLALDTSVQWHAHLVELWPLTTATALHRRRLVETPRIHRSWAVRARSLQRGSCCSIGERATAAFTPILPARVRTGYTVGERTLPFSMNASPGAGRTPIARDSAWPRTPSAADIAASHSDPYSLSLHARRQRRGVTGRRCKRRRSSGRCADARRSAASGGRRRCGRSTRGASG